MAKKKTTAKRRKSTPSVINQMELKTVRLINVTANLHIEGGGMPIGAKVNVESSYGINTTENTLLANVTAVVEGRPKTGSGSVMSMQITQQVMYSLKETLDTGAISDAEQDAINSMVTFVAWPYIRQLVQSLTAQMGIPPVILPVLRINIGGGAIEFPSDDTQFKAKKKAPKKAVRKK